MATGKGWKDVQKSIKQLRADLKQAREALEARDLEKARQLFNSCLQIQDQTNCGTKQDVLACHLGLADTSFGQKDYAQAEKSYQDSIEAIANDPAQIELTIALLVKRARALQWMQEADQAGALLERAAGLAKSKLAPGHLLISSTLEAQAQLLRKHHHSQYLADQLEEAARANQALKSTGERGGYNEKILDGLGPQDKTIGPTARKESAQGARIGRHRLLLKGEELGPPKVRRQITRFVAVTVAAGLIGFALVCLASDWFSQYQAKQQIERDKVIAASADLAGKGFKAADGVYKIILFEKGIAQVQFADLLQKGTYQWRENAGASSGSELVLNQIDKNTLIDANGIYLYTAEAPESNIIDQADFLSQTLNNYYQINSRYPDNDDDLRMFQPKVLFCNPYTSKVEGPCVLYFSDSQTFQTRLDQARDGKAWSGATPSSVQAAVLNQGSDHSFVIRISDRYGKFVTSSVPARAYILNSHNGDTASLQGIIKAEIDQRMEQLGNLQDKVVVVAAPRP